MTITRDTMVNTGTKARPVMSTVGEYAELKVTLAKELQEKLKEEFKQITF